MRVQPFYSGVLEVIKPQIVVACYGMNDGIYHPQSFRADAGIQGRCEPVDS